MATWIWIVLAIASSLMAEEINLQKFCESKDLTSPVQKLCKMQCENDIITIETNSTTSSPPKNNKPPQSSVWGYGILCVTIISLMSVMGVSFLPLMSKSFYDKLLTTLIGLAVGSLSGSALFHLIPSAFSLPDYDSNHNYLTISLVIWIGVYLFFIIERILKIIMEFKSRNNGFQPTGVQKVPTVESHFTLDSDVEENNPNKSNGGCTGDHIPKGEVYEHSKAAMRASFGHMERPDNSELRPTVDTIRDIEKSTHGSTIATVAWMIIFGDGVHNFIDGLSIGAAFSDSLIKGISVSTAVLCEEFPHELGDFAVLLNSGMNIKQAMLYNFLSACTCYFGLILGILLGEMQDGNQYIFAAAGGMFLYISLVDMVPELNSTIDQLSKQSLVEALIVFGLQNLGILIGIGSLFTLAKYQDEIQINF